MYAKASPFSLALVMLVRDQVLSLLSELKFLQKKKKKKRQLQHRGGSRGRVQGVRTPPPTPEMTCGFLIQLVFCQNKNYVVYWC